MAQSQIPTSRVNRIIKADKDIRLCSKEAVFLISKAAERMIEKTAEQAYETARLQKRNVKMVRYEHLATVAHQPAWFYLAEVIPHAVPLSTALALRRAANEGEADFLPTTIAAAASGSGSGTSATTAANSAGGPQGAEAGAAAAASASSTFTGKRILKSKHRKHAPVLGADGLATARKTRGKKIQLPKGEGGGEDDDDDEDEDEEEEEEEEEEEGPEEEEEGPEGEGAGDAEEAQDPAARGADPAPARPGEEPEPMQVDA
ncbi:hypothetical protein JCM8202_000249 [Rhodotorula sphaerocarpa]